MPVTPDDLFVDAGRDAYGLPATEVNIELLEAVLAGTYTDVTDAEVALALAEQVHADLTAYGTGGGQQLNDGQIKLAMRALKAACARVGVRFEPPFRDYTSFRAYWNKHDGHGSWQARRVMVGDLLDPAIEALEGLASSPQTHTLAEAALNALTDPSAIQDSLKRVARTVDSDPRMAVSAAKDLMESTAKLVLTSIGETYSKNDDLPVLASRAQTALGLTRKSLAAVPGQDMDVLGQLLGSLNGMVGGIAQLRNAVGVGHGRESIPEWVKPRHARLASGMATTWCSLLLETLADPAAPWRTTTT